MAGVIGLLPRSCAAPARSNDNGAVRAHLRDPAMLSLFGIGALLIGGMVVVFNYLPFRLEQAPYRLAPNMVSLIFLAYLWAPPVRRRLDGSLTESEQRRYWGPRVC
jgi:predicted MFS family arabinose efflux permease